MSTALALLVVCGLIYAFWEAVHEKLYNIQQDRLEREKPKRHKASEAELAEARAKLNEWKTRL